MTEQEKHLVELLVSQQPEPSSAQQRKANSVARKHGHGRANHVVIGWYDQILRHIPYGYVKDTTGEYVPNAYRSNFGWKNTHYVHAETTVEIAAS